MATNHKRKAKKLLRLPQVKAQTGLSRSTIYVLMERGEFPQSTKLSARVVAWSSNEIDAWVESKINQSAAA